MILILSQFFLIREGLNLLYIIGLLQLFKFLILLLLFGMLIIFTDEKRTFLKCGNIWVVYQISIADKCIIRKVDLLRCHFSAHRACRLLIDGDKFD